MRLEELRPAKGARQKRKRVGRGNASGHGNQSGRGTKGQKSRSGGRMVPGFEGGQTPLWKRLPKRGFHNRNRKSYAWINLDLLERAFEAGTEVTPEVLRQRGLLKGQKEVKILGRGKLTKRLVVRAHRFSRSAISAIEAAGGQAIQLESEPESQPEVK
ncbi:MAG: 50S ribosomal protein L15 [Candidatus Bipolaricaulia bacterium]